MKKELGQKIYRICGCDEEVDVVLKYGTYRINDSLAVSLYCRHSMLREEEEHNNAHFDELFGVITVNLEESAILPFGTQFVDVNNYPGINGWLVDNNIAESTSLSAHSGFCVYPALKFKLPER